MKYYSPLPVGPPARPRFTDGPSTSAHFVILTFYKSRGRRPLGPAFFFESLLFGSPGTTTGAGTAGGLGGAASSFSIFAILALEGAALLPADDGRSLFVSGDDKEVCTPSMDPGMSKLRMTAFTDSDNFFPEVALYALI